MRNLKIIVISILGAIMVSGVISCDRNQGVFGIGTFEDEWIDGVYLNGSELVIVYQGEVFEKSVTHNTSVIYKKKWLRGIGLDISKFLLRDEGSGHSSGPEISMPGRRFRNVFHEDLPLGARYETAAISHGSVIYKKYYYKDGGNVFNPSTEIVTVNYEGPRRTESVLVKGGENFSNFTSTTRGSLASILEREMHIILVPNTFTKTYIDQGLTSAGLPLLCADEYDGQATLLAYGGGGPLNPVRVGILSGGRRASEVKIPVEENLLSVFYIGSEPCYLTYGFDNALRICTVTLKRINGGIPVVFDLPKEWGYPSLGCNVTRISEDYLLSCLYQRKKYESRKEADRAIDDLLIKVIEKKSGNISLR